MKRTKKVVLTLLMFCLFVFILPVQQVKAAEEEGIIELQAARKASSGSYASLADQSFETTDLRSGKNVSFDGADGTYSIFLFGGIGTCENTSSAIASLSELTEYMDMNEVNIYLMDVKGNSTETIVNALEEMEASDEIFVCESTAMESVYYECYYGAGLNGYMMPFIAYVNADGEMYSYTTGPTTIKAMASNLTEGGLEVTYDLSLQTFYVTGEASYTYAFEVLDLLNEAREANGLSAIEMDQELLEAAMQRAAECAISFSHTRPDDSSCFTLSTRMSRENIAAGYGSPEAVMEGWLESSGHYANIMGEDNLSVGVGCVRVDGIWYWAQCFGRVEAETAVNKGVCENTYTITAVKDIVPELIPASGTIEVGETVTLKAVVAAWRNITIDNTSWQWSSDNEKVATVSSEGVITGKSAGTAVIMGKNISSSGCTLLYTVTVKESEIADTEEIPSETPEDSTGGSTDETPEDNTGGNTEETPDDNAGENTDETPDDNAGENTGETPDDNTDEDMGESVPSNGLGQAVDGNWYYYVNGEVDQSFTGLYCDANVGWWLVRNGQVAFDYTGLWCDPIYGWWLIGGGAVAFDYTGLWYDQTYGWWLIGGGAVAFDYTGLWYDQTYGWWLIGGGTVCFDYTGLWNDPNCGWWLIGGGAVCFDYNGLWNDPNCGWWLIQGGTIPFDYTGLYYDQYCGWWYIEGGTVGFGYTGVVYHDGVPYNVVNGMLV